jgi:hypothetical protein
MVACRKACFWAPGMLFSDSWLREAMIVYAERRRLHTGIRFI